eukprot:9726696-Heterocapsa_arctica.AAC.1
MNASAAIPPLIAAAQELLDFWRVQEQPVGPEIRHGAESDSPCWLDCEPIAAEYEWPLQAG